MNADFEEASHIAVDSTLRQLEHEDVLMVNRLSWLVASQSFLFTAYAIVLNQTSAAGTPVTVMRKGQLLQIVPELGLATCGLIYLGVVAGIYVTVALRREENCNFRRHRALWSGSKALGRRTRSDLRHRYCYHHSFLQLGL